MRRPPKDADAFQLVHAPSSRLATMDVGRIGLEKHQIAGLLEADVTEATRRLSGGSAPGVGFTAWIVKAVAAAVEAEPLVHAINQRRGKQVVFKDVDVALPISRLVEGREVPLVGVVREANLKSCAEVHAEIQAMKAQPVSSQKDYVLGNAREKLLLGLYLRLPSVLRRAAMKALMADPFVRRRKMGTVMVTNLGEKGLPPGWILTRSIHNLSIGVGSVRQQPWVVEGEVVPRQVLKLTLQFDHDVVDGLPAARFAAALVRYLEQAAFLP